MSKGNHIKAENCNKAKCKSCIFRTDGKALELAPGRMAEITNYLATFQTSHLCHVTEKTCYGALEYQANLLFRMNMIPENTVKSFLETAKLYL